MHSDDFSGFPRLSLIYNGFPLKYMSEKKNEFIKIFETLFHNFEDT